MKRIDVMTNDNISISDGNRRSVLEYIETMKTKKETFTVVDVGGSYNGWSFHVLDAIIDFNDPPPCSKKNIKHFKMDITHPDSWREVLEYVEKVGKFDFCICTHTLEDIMNPVFVGEQMGKIAHAGYIAVPSKYRELARFENHSNSYRGYIHHRWIFNMENGAFVGYPKINYVENNSTFDAIADLDDRRSDLSFYWKGRVDIRYLNNNFLGPNVEAVIGYYYRLLT